MGGRQGNRVKWPRDAASKWEWILEHGRPTYRERAIGRQTLPSGELLTVYAPPDNKRDREEVQRVAHLVFRQAKTLQRKQKILRAYASQFPHLAWDPSSWLWPLWWVWRARQDKDNAASKLLTALASGVRAPASGWMSQKRFGGYRLEMARSVYDRLRESDDYVRYSKASSQWVRGIRSPHGAARRHAGKTFIKTFAALRSWIRSETGREVTLRQLKELTFSRLVREAVATTYGVRESDLH